MPAPYVRRDGPRVTLSSKEKLTLYRLLDTYLTKVDDEHADYKEGWSDQRIADEAAKSGNRADVSHVTRIRRDAYGNFSRKVSQAKNPGQGKLRQQLNALQDAFNKLAVLTDHPELRVGVSNVQPE